MKNALNLKRLRRAVVLSRIGSFARASVELNISQSALSRSIIELESDLGTTLFVRRHKGLQLTIAGGEFLRAAESLLDNAARIEAYVTGSNLRISEEVAFGIGAMPASVLLPELLTRTLQSGEGPILDIRTSTAHDLLDQLNKEEIGFFLAARQTIGCAPHIVVEPFARLPLAVRVRAGHPLAGAGHVSWDEAIKYPIIGTRFRMGGKAMPQDPAYPYSPIISTTDYTLLAHAVRKSDAMCVFVATMETDGLVTLNTTPGFSLELEISLARLRGSSLSDAASSVVGIMREIALEQS